MKKKFATVLKKTAVFGVLLCAVLAFSACGTITSGDAAEFSDDVVAIDTDAIPEEGRMPTEGEEQEIDKSVTGTVTLSVECSTILDNINSLDKNKVSIVPEDGIIYPAQKVTFYQGETVFDVLKREMIENKIHFEFSESPVYQSVYIEGIANFYEFDCGDLSGWTYCVNGWFPNYGCSRFLLTDGDVVEWHYTCDLGKDVGSEM